MTAACKFSDGCLKCSVLRPEFNNYAIAYSYGARNSAGFIEGGKLGGDSEDRDYFWYGPP